MNRLLSNMVETIKNNLYRKPVVPQPYYQIQINDHNTRTNKILSFDTLKDAMRHVNQGYLIYQPLVDIFLIHVKYDGPNAIIRLNTATQNVLEDRQCLYRAESENKSICE